LTVRDLILSSHNVVVLSHQNADPDAIASMVAFSRLYRALNPSGTVTLACDDVSKVAGQILTTFNPEIAVTSGTCGEFDLTVLVDTNSSFQIGPKLDSLLHNPSRTLVIDHHEDNPKIGEMASHQMVDAGKSSTCEIMVSLFDELGIPVDSGIANILLAGLLFDTRRFLHGGLSGLKTGLRLIESGADYDRCLSSLIVRPDRSERIARLKAAGRLQIHEVGEWIIVTSKVSAYEASACRALLDLGADVAVVGGSSANETVRISSRSTSDFHRATDVSMSRDVMEKVGEIIDGAGGGHANAAGANGHRNLDKALSTSVDLIQEAIRTKQKLPQKPT